MRYLLAILIVVVALTFSGIPEFVSGILDDQSAYAEMQDDAESKSKEESKEKDENEDGKESLLSAPLVFNYVNSATSIEIHNGIIRDSGFYPEDHTPPPERI